jgi:hypothetical protein
VSAQDLLSQFYGAASPLTGTPQQREEIGLTQLLAITSHEAFPWTLFR